MEEINKGGWRAMLKAIAPRPMVVAAIYGYAGICLGSYYWATGEKIKFHERNIEKNTRCLLESWKKDIQAGFEHRSLDEFRASLGLDGAEFKQFDKLFDDYRKYDPTK